MLDDRLLIQLKARAAESGISVSRLDQGARLLMRAAAAANDTDPFELIHVRIGRSIHAPSPPPPRQR